MRAWCEDSFEVNSVLRKKWRESFCECTGLSIKDDVLHIVVSSRHVPDLSERSDALKFLKEHFTGKANTQYTTSMVEETTSSLLYFFIFFLFIYFFFLIHFFFYFNFFPF